MKKTIVTLTIIAALTGCDAQNEQTNKAIIQIESLKLENQQLKNELAETDKLVKKLSRNIDQLDVMFNSFTANYNELIDTVSKNADLSNSRYDIVVDMGKTVSNNKSNIEAIHDTSERLDNELLSHAEGLDRINNNLRRHESMSESLARMDKIHSKLISGVAKYVGLED